MEPGGGGGVEVEEEEEEDTVNELCSSFFLINPLVLEKPLTPATQYDHQPQSEIPLQST